MEQSNKTHNKQGYLCNPANWVALFTLFAVLGYTGIQLWQTILIRENNVVSQRAFVFAESAGAVVGLNANDKTTKIVNFAFTLKNSGNTATKNLEFSVGCRRSPDDLKEPWGLLYQEPVTHLPNFIGPHATISIHCALALSDMTEIQNGKLFGYIIGEATYRDRLDESVQHKTQFAWKITDVNVFAPPIPGLPENIIFVLSGVGNHNCADECPN